MLKRYMAAHDSDFPKRARDWKRWTKGGAKSEGGSATMRAETRVNAEQAPKPLSTRKPTLRKSRGRPPTGREESDTSTGRFPPG